MIRGFGCAALLVTWLAAPPALGQEATCATDAAEDPVCEFRIHGGGDRFTGEETELRFNFPLFLHAAGTGGDYCVRVAASGCEGGCAGQVGLAVGDSAVMREEADPRLR